MEDCGAMILSTFELSSVRDAGALFEACIKNAFPTFNFRRLELIRFVKDDQYMEGRSWNMFSRSKIGTEKPAGLGGPLPPGHHGPHPR